MLSKASISVMGSLAICHAFVYFMMYYGPTATIHVDQCLDVAILVARYNIVQVIGEQQLIITLSLQHRESIL